MKVHETGSEPLEWRSWSLLFCIRAWLQPCRKRKRNNTGLAPDLYVLGGTAAKAGFYLQPIGTTLVVP